MNKKEYKCCMKHRKMPRFRCKRSCSADCKKCCKCGSNRDVHDKKTLCYYCKSLFYDTESFRDYCYIFAPSMNFIERRKTQRTTMFVLATIFFTTVSCLQSNDHDILHDIQILPQPVFADLLEPHAV